MGTAELSTSLTLPMTLMDTSPPSPTMAKLSTLRLSPLPMLFPTPLPTPFALLSTLWPALSSMQLLLSMLPSTLLPCTVEPAMCPTSRCPSPSRESTGPPPSPRPSEPTLPLSTTHPAPSMEPTVGVQLLLMLAMLVTLPTQLLIMPLYPLLSGDLFWKKETKTFNGKTINLVIEDLTIK